MDDVARGIATAALTVQSALLQALVAHGAMSPEQALEVVDVNSTAIGGKRTNRRLRVGTHIQFLVLHL
jgi:hypothetical protein